MVLQRLVDAGLDHIQITLESHNPQVHDKITGVAGSWEETVMMELWKHKPEKKGRAKLFSPPYLQADFNGHKATNTWSKPVIYMLHSTQYITLNISAREGGSVASIQERKGILRA